MKQYLIITLLFINVSLLAQSNEFKVDCGNDTIFCMSLDMVSDTFYVGSKINLANGTSPYKYAWSCKPKQVTSNIIFTASDYLTDTTIQNPCLKDFIRNEKWVFYLTVTDNDNKVATDSICIQLSSFIYRTIEYDFNLNKGDSLQFYYDHFVGGGIPPANYYWTPVVGLDDSTKIDTWCKPQQTTSYYQYIIDSAGCKSLPNRAYNIYMPSSAKTVKEGSTNLLNFYQTGSELVFNNPLNKKAKLFFYSTDGKIILSTQTSDSFFDISEVENMSKIVICVLYLNGLRSTIKIVLAE